MCRRKPIPFTLEQNFLSRLPKLRAKRDGSSRRPSCGTAAPAGRSCLDSRGHSFVCGPAQGRGPPSRYLRVGLPPLPGGNVQQDVLVLSRPQHIAVSRVAHEPLSAPSRSPTSQTVMRSGSFIPYHTPNHIRQNMFKHGCLHRNSCSRHRSRGSWSTAP